MKSPHSLFELACAISYNIKEETSGYAGRDLFMGLFYREAFHVEFGAWKINTYKLPPEPLFQGHKEHLLCCNLNCLCLL